MSMYGSYDPFMGTAQGYNPSSATAIINAANGKATEAYQTAMAQNQSDTLAFNRAQAAFTDAMSLGSAYGYSMGGNPYNFGSQMLPPAGTPLQSTMNTLGYGGAIPGATGFNTGTTIGAQQAYAQMAQAGAGLTGSYAAPATSKYSPGTFVRLDPSTYDYGTQGDQISYVLPSGQLQRVSTTQAKQMGWNGNLSDLSVLPAQQALMLENAPPQQLPQQTLQGLQTYSGLNTAAQANAVAQSGVTGMYQAPSQIYAPGTNAGGGRFQDLDQQTQQAYFLSNGGDWTAAQNKWVADSNQAIAAANGGQLPNQPGTPTETMAAQNQYFNQANALASQYGQYYAPGAPGQAGQAGVNAPNAGQQTQSMQQQMWQQGFSQEQLNQQASNQYLTLLSQLQGPADYGKYLNVLGSTPGGLQGMVSAAAGNYIPGTGTTGASPQGQTLQNLVGAASGQAGGGTGANAQSNQNWTLGSGQGGSASPGGMNYQNYMATAQGLPAPNQIAPQAFGNMTPSQQQMMGGMYQQLGYYGPDINAMYQQSLPKYAAGSAAGTTKLV